MDQSKVLPLDKWLGGIIAVRYLSGEEPDLEDVRSLAADPTRIVASPLQVNFDILGFDSYNQFGIEVHRRSETATESFLLPWGAILHITAVSPEIT